MYDRFAAVYDAIYSFKKYDQEVEKLVEIARTRNPQSKTWLDVACGTGAHIEFLRKDFACTGVDLSEALLQVARAKHPDVDYRQGDMRAFDLGKKFDVVSCLFGAMGYMLEQKELALAAARLASHVAPGGVLLIEPFVSKSKFTDGNYNLMTAQTEDMKVARTNTSRIQNGRAEMDFHFLVVNSKGTDHFQEVHTMGLFDHEDYVRALEDAGMTVTVEDEGLMGRGLYIAGHSQP